jgi:hypothetical protein
MIHAFIFQGVVHETWSIKCKLYKSMIKPTKHTNSSKNVTIFMVVSSVGKFFIIGIKNQQVSITYMDF